MADRTTVARASFQAAVGLALWPYLALAYLHAGRRPLFCTQWDPWPELFVMIPALLALGLSAIAKFEARRLLLMVAILAIWPVIFVGCNVAVRIGGETEFFSTRP